MICVLVANPNNCCCDSNEKEEEESAKTLLHAVDIRAAKRTQRLPPVGERIGTWRLCVLSQIYPHDPRYPGRYSVASWPMKNRARFATSRQHLTHQFIKTFDNEVGLVTHIIHCGTYQCVPGVFLGS